VRYAAPSLFIFIKHYSGNMEQSVKPSKDVRKVAKHYQHSDCTVQAEPPGRFTSETIHRPHAPQQEVRESGNELGHLGGALSYPTSGVMNGSGIVRRSYCERWNVWRRKG
jgi:hypothetical protein